MGPLFYNLSSLDLFKKEFKTSYIINVNLVYTLKQMTS